MLSIQYKTLLFTLILSFTLGQACQESESPNTSTQPSKSSGSSEDSASVAATSTAVYSSNNPYKSSSVDPLAALYGGQVGKSQKVSVDDLKSRFDDLAHSPLLSPFPKTWRKTINQLSKSIDTKVVKWSSTTRTRMERGKRDKVIQMSLSFFGEKTKVEREIGQALSRIKELKKIPKNLSQVDQKEIKQGDESLSLSYDTESAKSDNGKYSVLASLDITWGIERPNPSGELKNCRYVHALEASLAEGDIPWAKQHFKSTSTRRFVEWYVSQVGQERSWTSTWIYRNGSYRDKAVAWWSKKLTALGAKQKSLYGMEQTWTMPKKKEIDWWPESNPSPMGCEIAGPFLSVRLSKAGSN